MKPRFGEWDLDCELVFDRSLAAGGELDELQVLLPTLAPKWTKKLHLWRGPKDQRPVDLDDPGSLRTAVIGAAAERGSTYSGMIQSQGRPPLERLTGAVELRGSGPELVIVVSLDEMVVSPLGSRRQLGNRVGLQVRRPKVEGRGAGEWMSNAMHVLCASLSPAWGSAGHAAEYWAKVMSDGPRVEAVGRDFGRHLPGIFWLNFFGVRLCRFLGDARLESTPTSHVTEVGGGILIELGSSPLRWDTPEYVIDEERVRDHLGPELFYSKAHPDRLTVVPDWES